MEELHCHHITKHLAKIYIDVFLTSIDSVDTLELQLFGIAAIRLAIKVNYTIIQFNESCDYPAATALINTGKQYTLEQLLMAEQKLLLVLKFKLKYTTPYCYIKLIKELMPMGD
jgi:hypothetical protein